jgi:hypothetical protein
MTGWPPAVQLVLASATLLAARRFLLRAAPTPTAAGSAVMAIGIFGLSALPQIAGGLAGAIQPLAVGLCVLWGCIAASYAAAYLEGAFAAHVEPPVGRFAIGTWVAGTAMLLRLLLLGAPEWRVLAVLLGLLAAIVWLWFLAVAAKALRAVGERSSHTLVSSVVLLATVSTQSLALVVFDLAPEPQLFRWAALCLIALGAAFYVVGAALVLRSHVRATGWTLADDWDSANCILHGAMSITGLAVVLWQAAPTSVALALWLYVLCVFAAVEAAELARLWTRLRRYGWRRGVFTYGVAQWSRIFTFGMFHAFTVALAQQPDGSGGIAWVAAAQSAVLACGPYVVLGLLVVEIALYLDARLDRAPFAAAARLLGLRSSSQG